MKLSKYMRNFKESDEFREENFKSPNKKFRNKIITDLKILKKLNSYKNKEVKKEIINSGISTRTRRKMLKGIKKAILGFKILGEAIGEIIPDKKIYKR